MGWVKGLKNLKVFTDSTHGYNLILRENMEFHPYKDVIEEIREMLAGDWIATVMFL